MPLSDIIDSLPDAEGAYLVGGTVRDILIDRPPMDIDIAVARDARRFAERLAESKGGRLVVMGSPGKTVYRVAAGDRLFDITPLAGDSLEKDLGRRDFTINAMALSLCSRTLVDLHGGQRDLRSGTIRMVHPSVFHRDPIRLLRAYRCAADLNFKIDSPTAEMITRQARLISAAAAERIREEFFKMLQTPRCHPHLKGMAASGLVFHIFPELKPLGACRQNPAVHRFDAWTHTLAALDELEAILASPPTDAVARWVQSELHATACLKTALLLHDIGKPTTRSVDPGGVIHFFGHEKTGASMAARISQRLRFSARERAFIDFIIGHHLRPLHLFTQWIRGGLSSKAQTRFFMHCADLTPPLLLHALADMRAKGGERSAGRAFARFVSSQLEAFETIFTPRKAAPPLITGHDLITALHWSPSPIFKAVLDFIAEEQLTGGVQTREAALAAARAFAARRQAETGERPFPNKNGKGHWGPK
jgi:putative nucleotidyltransferase with HDIG domain